MGVVDHRASLNHSTLAIDAFQRRQAPFQLVCKRPDFLPPAWRHFPRARYLLVEARRQAERSTPIILVYRPFVFGRKHEASPWVVPAIRLIREKRAAHQH